MLFVPLVLIRADRTGGMTAPIERFEWTEHSALVVPVQEPSPASVRFKVYPLYICALVMGVV